MDEMQASYVELAYAERDAIVRSIARRFGNDAEDYVAEAYAQCCAAAVTDEVHAAKWVTRAAAHLAIDAKSGHARTRRHASRLVAPDSTESVEDRYLDSELRADGVR